LCKRISRNFKHHEFTNATKGTRILFRFKFVPCFQFVSAQSWNASFQRHKNCAKRNRISKIIVMERPFFHLILNERVTRLRRFVFRGSHTTQQLYTLINGKLEIFYEKSKKLIEPSTKRRICFATIARFLRLNHVCSY